MQIHADEYVAPTSRKRLMSMCFALSPRGSGKMNASCDPAVMAYEQSSGCDLDGSCDRLSPPHCNWTAAAAAGGAPQLPTFSTAAKVRVIVTFILCGVSAFCNLAVLWAANDHKRKSHVRVLIINLTAADLLVTFIVMPVDAVWNITVQWLAGDLACRFLMFLKLQAMYSCAFVTVVISLDRQSAILNPLAINMARRRNRDMLAVAWTLSALFSIPQMFIFHNVTITYPANFTQCTTRGSFITHWQETAYNMFTFSCLFLLPLVMMIICYTRIFIQISKRMTTRSLSSNEPHLRCSKNNIPKARMRTLKMSIVIVISFIVCWTPYYLLGLWYWFFPDDLEGKVSHSLTHILFIFGLFNACLDPIIYGLFTIRFRKGLRSCYRKSGPMSDREMKCAAAAAALPSKRGMGTVEKDGDWGRAESESSEGRSLSSRVGGGQSCHFSAESTI
ncbi:gonadotropin-releasing hormone II receptor-like [Clinocottus analis]|uniref:gonadotropin-releasing hormone II receptor-like n=1 Tax=Clinocottus analis TaxID=304258 RepID=UPI0035C07BAE